MAKPIFAIIDVSFDETHYVPYMDLPHETDRLCRCQPDIYIGLTSEKVEHRPWSSLTPADQ
jgi:hypothetical protein